MSDQQYFNELNSVTPTCRWNDHSMRGFIFVLQDKQDELEYEFCSWECFQDWVAKETVRINT